MSELQIPDWLKRSVQLSKRTELRHKASEMLRILNGGSSSIKVLGFSFDVLSEFDRRIGTLTDQQVDEVLEVLRQ